MGQLSHKPPQGPEFAHAKECKHAQVLTSGRRSLPSTATASWRSHGSRAGMCEPASSCRLSCRHRTHEGSKQKLDERQHFPTHLLAMSAGTQFPHLSLKQASPFCPSLVG